MKTDENNMLSSRSKSHFQIQSEKNSSMLFFNRRIDEKEAALASLGMTEENVPLSS